MIRYVRMERKSISVIMGPGGVEVRMPRWARLRDPKLRQIVVEQLEKAAAGGPTEADPPRPLSREQFDAEAAAWAARLGVRPHRVQVRSMTSRWGSCSSNGNVTFSDRTFTMPASLRQYLICHEFVHLRVLNHGPEFRHLMDDAMPDWKERERALGGWVARVELASLRRRA
ncbi:MAG: M48 metallopeptidase family protein [Anaerolineae bacterium]